VLDMDREDLHVLVVGSAGAEEVDGLLYDPLPGGSGLLQQILARWDDVVAAASKAVAECPSGCLRSCVDCLQTFRNAFYHRHLDRHALGSRTAEWGTKIAFEHDIPARMPDVAPRGREVPASVAEHRLRHMLKRAGFPEPRWQHQILLGLPLGSTTPDCFFPGEDPGDPGVCIYLDGLSQHIHGNPVTAAKDRQIRGELRSRGYMVFEIAATELADAGAMTRHFYRLAQILMGKDEARGIREREDWFAAPGAGGDTAEE
jgi:hypothetical protein